MRWRMVQEHRPRTWVVVFDLGEDPMKGLRAFAEDNLLGTCQFTAIGGFSKALLGYFNVEAKEYKRLPILEQVEVLALSGNITDSDDGRTVHAHVVLGASDGRALGGHLLEAMVRPTLELVLTESPAHLQRREDPATHLPLINA